MKTNLLIVLVVFCSFQWVYGQEVKLGTPVAHSSYITQMEFVQDDELIVTVSDDNTAKVWDVKTQKVLQSFEDHEGRITYSKIYNDEFLITYSYNRKGNSNYGYDSTANIYSITNGTNLFSLDLRAIQMKSLNAIKIDAHNKRMAFLSTDNSIYVVSLLNQDTISVIQTQNLNVSSFHYSEDGQFIYTSGESVIKWDTEKGTKLSESQKFNLKYKNTNFGNSNVPICVRSSSTFYFLDRTTLSLIHTLEAPGHNQIVFGPKGKYFLTHSSYDGHIKLWSFDDYEFKKLNKLNYDFKTLFFDNNEEYVCVHLKNPINKLRFKNVFVWDTKNGAKVLEGQHSSDAKPPVFTKNSSGIFIDNAKWEIKSAQQDPTIDFSDKISLFVSLAIGKNGNSIAYSDYRDFWVRTADNENLYFKGGDFSSYLSIHDGYFVSIGKKKQDDNKTEIEFNQYWSVKNGLPLKDVGHSSYYLPKFNRIVEYHGSYDEVTVKIFDEKKDTLLNEISFKAKWNEANPTINYETSELVFSAKNKLYVVNCSTATLDFEASHSVGFSQTIQISSDKKYIAIGLRRGVVDLFNFKTGEKIKSLNGYQGGVHDLQFSADCSKLAITGFIDADIYDLENEKFVFQQKVGKKDLIFFEDILSQVLISPDGKMVAICNSDKHLTEVYSISGNKLLYSVEHNGGWSLNDRNRMLFSDNSKLLITMSKSSSILIQDAQTGGVLQSLDGHNNDITDVLFIGEDTLVTCSSDLSLRYWDLISGDLLITHRYLNNNLDNWVHIHPSGLFDASQEAMSLMYWVKGTDIIQFDQLKENYWVPGLWGMVMNGESLPTVSNIDNIQLEPEVVFGEIENNTLPILLTKRGGGYGEVSVSINGKETTHDISDQIKDTSAAQQTIYYKLSDEKYLVDGENEYVVKASSANGNIQGRGEMFDMFVEDEDGPKEPTQFFGVVIGVSDYKNEKINLKYSVSDALAVTTAISLGAENLYGEDNTFIYSINSKGNTKPTKDNIQKVFTDIAAKANAHDVILVYLSGHGVTWGGEKGDFYYLTADATAASKSGFNDAAVRQNTTISTGELVEWLKEIPALKQVMIIDACGSGKAVDNLMASRNIEGSQIKALDRMKDRTGMYVISGCASDAVSYEASQYGQGLLTYSILEGMRGAAIESDGSVDVELFMRHARERVPELAKGLGGIQQPQLLAPKGGSFDIGILEESDKEAIPLASPKDIFVRSAFMNTEEMEDDLDLSGLLDAELGLLASRGAEASIVFFDAKKYPNACKISGGYTVDGSSISLKMKLRCGEEKKEFNITGESKEELIKTIIEKVEGLE